MSKETSRGALEVPPRRKLGFLKWFGTDIRAASETAELYKMNWGGVLGKEEVLPICSDIP